MNQTRQIDARINAMVTTVTVAALSTFGAIAPAHAKITAYFSAGISCAGKPTASFAKGGSAVKMSLCVTTTVERLCGHTTKLQAAETAENARFYIAAVTRGPSYSDPNSEPSYPLAVTNPPAVTDFGATVTRVAAGPAANQLLVTFDLLPQANATADAYTISLAAVSSVGVSADGTCTLPTDSPIAGSFVLIQHTDKEPRK